MCATGFLNWFLILALPILRRSWYSIKSFDRLHPKGIECEADPRQVEELLVDIEIEGANGEATPSQKILSHQVQTEEKLSDSNFTCFRGLAARANYLAGDRSIDVLYNAKEVSLHDAPD